MNAKDYEIYTLNQKLKQQTGKEEGQAQLEEKVKELTNQLQTVHEQQEDRKKDFEQQLLEREETIRDLKDLLKHAQQKQDH